MTDPTSRLNAALEGRYHIERELGAGGMATVYLARDLKHNRNVALKVLKPELAAVVGAERFLAEIETTANLQHPHILPLFDSGEADSFLFYVMPYIEGETLRERIDRERQLPVDEALGIATAVAHALQTAHEAGVIHRDIKPGNILLSRGQPLVSDFGIALAVGAAGGGRLTETGLSVGTPFYMSPEQATGDQMVGPASDTYALACVLYEMLTGDPPYIGSTAQAVLGKIIQGIPVSATAVRKSVPANVDAAIRKALERLPADRFTRAEDFARALSDTGFRHGEQDEAAAAAGSALWKRVAAATGAATVVLGAALTWTLTRPVPPLPVERFESPFRAGQVPTDPSPGGFALSPDGTMLAYVGPNGEGSTQLWIRRWDEPEATPVRASVVANYPSFSPDGRELAFFRGAIFALSLDGGPVRELGPGNAPYWGPDGYVYSFTLATAASAQRVPGGGGTVEIVSENTATRTSRRFVHGILPGGGALMLVVPSLASESEIHALDLATGESRFLVQGRSPSYSETGNLLYVADGALMAAPFDPSAMELLGPSVTVIDDVGHATLSRTGKLVYSVNTGGSVEGNRELVWVSRSGDMEPVEEGWTFDSGQGNEGWSISPDGTRIALRARREGNFDIWIKDLPAGPLRRLTFEDTEQRIPSWTPDGERVTYLSDGEEGYEVWWRPADGTGQPERLVPGSTSYAQAAWDPSGEWLALRVSGPVLTTNAAQGVRDILGFRPGVDSAPVPLVATPEYAEQSPVISPDGRWMAYLSDETGRNEVFVRPFPDVDSGKVQVSSNGGVSPLWSRSGEELFYIDGDQNMISVRFSTSPTFRVTGQEPLFVVHASIRTSPASGMVDISLDGERFLMGRQPGGGTADGGARLVVVNNFDEVLRRLGSR